jgi:hypothetical protein
MTKNYLILLIALLQISVTSISKINDQRVFSIFVEISISTPKKSQSRPSRKSRQVLKTGLDAKDVLDLDLDWSRRRDPQANENHLIEKVVQSYWIKYTRGWSFDGMTVVSMANLPLACRSPEILGMKVQMRVVLVRIFYVIVIYR